MLLSPLNKLLLRRLCRHRLYDNQLFLLYVHKCEVVYP